MKFLPRFWKQIIHWPSAIFFPANHFFISPSRLFINERRAPVFWGATDLSAIPNCNVRHREGMAGKTLPFLFPFPELSVKIKY